MAAGNIVMAKQLAMIESDSTERAVDLPGMCSVLNLGAAEVFISAEQGAATTKVQTDGTIVLPVNVPVPLPREMRTMWHKTAASTAVILIVCDVR